MLMHTKWSGTLKHAEAVNPGTYFIHLVPAWHVFTAVFIAVAGARPRQWSAGVSNTLLHRQNQWNQSDREHSCAVLRLFLGCSALWGLAEPLSCGRSKINGKDDRLWRSETWSHVALDSFTLSALSPPFPHAWHVSLYFEISQISCSHLVSNAILKKKKKKCAFL